jgi:hypothetical protein
MTQSQDPRPTLPRAVVCLLLNVIVFPGLGTLLSGEPQRRKTGFVQLGLGALLIPFMVLAGIGTLSIAGMDPDMVKAWIANFMLILVGWNLLTGVRIIGDARARAKAERGSAG